jgi:hypothetical protein
MRRRYCGAIFFILLLLPSSLSFADPSDVTNQLVQLFKDDLDKLQKSTLCYSCGCSLSLSKAMVVSRTGNSFRFLGTIRASGNSTLEKFSVIADVSGEISIPNARSLDKCKLKFLTTPAVKIEKSSRTRICSFLAEQGAKSEFAAGKGTDLNPNHCDIVRVIHRSLP